MDISIASPEGYEPKPEIIDLAMKNSSLSGSKVEITNIRKSQSKTQMLFIPMYGLAWDRKKKLQKGKKYLPLIRLC